MSQQTVLDHWFYSSLFLPSPLITLLLPLPFPLLDLFIHSLGSLLSHNQHPSAKSWATDKLQGRQEMEKVNFFPQGAHHPVEEIGEESGEN